MARFIQINKAPSHDLDTIWMDNRLDDQTQNQGAFANGEKNSSSDAGPSKFGDLEAILEAHLNAQAETQKPNPRRGRPRKTAAVRRTKKTVAEGSSGDQANPDDVIGTIGRKPRTRRVKTTSVQRVGRRRTAVEKADDGKKEIRGRKAKIFIPDLDLESVNRAQSFELLAKIFDREARRESRRLNRHNNKEVVVAAPSPPTTGDDNCLVGESSIKEPPTVFQVRAESGDVVSLEKTIVNENPESNATNREEDTAV